MRLSEAIRLGAMGSPQGFGQIEETRVVSRETQFFGTLTVDVVQRCALGSAFWAAGCERVEEVSDADSQGFRGLVVKGSRCTVIQTPVDWPMHVRATCPACLGDVSFACDAIGVAFNLHAPVMRLEQLIPHLNDFHKWSREQIADFVETVERAQTVKAANEERTNEAVRAHIARERADLSTAE